MCQTGYMPPPVGGPVSTDDASCADAERGRDRRSLWEEVYVGRLSADYPERSRGPGLAHPRATRTRPRGSSTSTRATLVAWRDSLVGSDTRFRTSAPGHARRSGYWHTLNTVECVRIVMRRQRQQRHHRRRQAHRDLCCEGHGYWDAWWQWNHLKQWYSSGKVASITNSPGVSGRLVAGMPDRRPDDVRLFRRELDEPPEPMGLPRSLRARATPTSRETRCSTPSCSTPCSTSTSRPTPRRSGGPRPECTKGGQRVQRVVVPAARRPRWRSGASQWCRRHRLGDRASAADHPGCPSANCCPGCLEAHLRRVRHQVRRRAGAQRCSWRSTTGRIAVDPGRLPRVSRAAARTWSRRSTRCWSTSTRARTVTQCSRCRRFPRQAPRDRARLRGELDAGFGSGVTSHRRARPGHPGIAPPRCCRPA